MRKVELYERIRRDQAERGWSIRRLAKEHRTHRREVRQTLLSARPPERVGSIDACVSPKTAPSPGRAAAGPRGGQS